MPRKKNSAEGSNRRVAGIILTGQECASIAEILETCAGEEESALPSILRVMLQSNESDGSGKPRDEQALLDSVTQEIANRRGKATVYRRLAAALRDGPRKGEKVEVPQLKGQITVDEVAA